jgi:glucosamine-6-phosphate deaminase
MRVFVKNDYEAMSQAAANSLLVELRNLLEHKQQVVFVPSAGGTPTRLFQLLFEKKSQIDWGRIVLCQMDDYVGLSPQHPNSLANYLINHVIEPLGISRYHLLISSDGQLLFKGPDYDALIDKLGGVDIFVHGIGENGHLGFNEPGCTFDSKTRQVKLTESTRNANSRFFLNKNEIPQYGITMGLFTIFNAQTNFVLASGEKKRDAINRLILGEKDMKTPASILADHSNTYVFVDKDAASDSVQMKICR